MSTTPRPYTICHMMSSLDGKIASGLPGVELFDDYFDLYTKTEDEIRGQAWMCGRVTMQMFASQDHAPLPHIEKNLEVADHLVPSVSGLYMIGVDTKGLLRWQGNTIQLSNVEKPLSLVIAVCEATPMDYLHYLQSLGISYVFGGQDTLDFEKLLPKLQSHFGINTLLIEGGGNLNGSMLVADVIDEISLLLLPIAVNCTHSPSVFDQPTKTINLKKFSLLEARSFEQNTVRLRYKRS